MYAHAQCAAITLRYNGAKIAAPYTAASPSSALSNAASCACKIPGVVLSPSTSQEATQQQQHVWIKGNIDPMDSCSLCGLFCGSILALSGLKCSWCHARVHEECYCQALNRSHKPPLLRRCDLGRHANFVLPPSCVILHEPTLIESKSQRALNSVRSAAHIAVAKVTNLRLRRGGASGAIDVPSQTSSHICNDVTLNRESITSSAVTEFDGLPYDVIETAKEITPLLLFINGRSGGNMGLHVLRQARMWLNPVQVYDLSHQTPIEPLRRFVDLPRLRILICGGDGTVGWVLSALDEIKASRQPPIAILPLGTGNDLARVLGWGAGFSAPIDVSEILSEVEVAHVSMLDRWLVEIGDSKKRVVLNNYLGIGVDAQVALEFHEQRERSPGLFVSQFVNKLWYSQFGAKNFLVRACAGLSHKIALVCDGKLIALPEGTEGVILLNINSYGGGSKLWFDDLESSDDDSDSASDGNEDRSRSCSIDSFETSTNFGPSSRYDGLLDVVAVYGTLHLGQMQVGLSKAVRLCQAKTIKITLSDTLPLQIDGEPWLQSPSEIDISFFQQAFMLSRTVEERDLVTNKVGEVLDWAELTHVISSRQRDVLLVEIARRIEDSADSINATRSRACAHHRGHQRLSFKLADR
ncbi:hypothetical protein CCR75_005940 [Bremia lactucae]|uniref:Diacylglycerol kinase n=1 Tax=Bremia lactucae TaxID=4779 RepID=A0A976ICZ9_BRELC|nr:hypothetical protein CCR75_005940 [Bremia lactucae]